jgi:hypothetical protein
MQPDPTPESDVARIAAGLTKAQRASMTASWHRKPGGQIIPCDASVRGALARRGLLTTAYGFATPLGLAVQAHLQSQGSPDAR